LTITVLSPTQLSINPILPAVCGINTIAVTAPSSVAGGAPVTQTVTFNLVCPGQPVNINICNAGNGGSGGGGLGIGGDGLGIGGTGTGGAGVGSGGGGGAGGDACNINLVGGPSLGQGGHADPIPPGSSGGGGGGGAGGAGGGGGAGGAGGSGGAGGAGGAGGTAGTPGAPGTPGTPGVSGQSVVVASSQGLLSRTGTNAVRYLALALALVVAGAVLTVGARRRANPGRAIG
jgi:hypothetical protein